MNLSAGFEVEGHYELEKGCRCGNCKICTGWLIGTASGAICADRPEAHNITYQGCVETVLDYDDAVNLVQSVKDVEALLAEIERLTHP